MTIYLYSVPWFLPTLDIMPGEVEFKAKLVYFVNSGFQFKVYRCYFLFTFYSFFWESVSTPPLFL